MAFIEDYRQRKIALYRRKGGAQVSLQIDAPQMDLPEGSRGNKDDPGAEL